MESNFQNETSEQKQSLIKKTWFIVLMCIFFPPIGITFLWIAERPLNIKVRAALTGALVLYMIIAIAATGDSDKEVKEEKQAVTEEVRQEEKKLEKPVTGEKTTEEKVETSNEETTEDSTETDSFELVAGETGEYGKEIIMSEGTDCEEKLIVYYVPAGKYTVENLGEFRTQVSVYEGYKKNEETGYDEYTKTGDIIVLEKNGATGEIEVPEGWFVEIHKPTHISLSIK